MISNQQLKKEELLVITYQRTKCPKAYGKLYEVFYQTLFDYLCKFTNSPEDAFDITQETFIHASTEIFKLKQPITFRFWLFRIAKNKCLRKYKTDKRMSAVLYENDTFAQDYDISEAIEKDLQLEKLHLVLSTLSPEERHLLLSKYSEDVSINDLISSTGLGSSAIKMKLLRSRKKVLTAMASN